MADATIDRNLLFGALALQDYLIDSAQLGEACVLWATQMHRPLAELLLERGWIAESDRAEVERRMERLLHRHGGDARASLAAVAGTEARDAIRRAEDAGIRKTMNALPTAAGYVLAETLAPLTDPIRSRYTRSRLHAEGGLGKVWVARDTELNREVALKELRSEQAADPEMLRRFLKEAQVTGQLEHPNIVPVYELARRPEDDRPFYTMRLVRGRTLREAIADYHSRRAEEGMDLLGLQKLLVAFVGVCQAVGYAHSRGVIHRDLKPENVVLGDFGEVILLDWGLAKMLDQTPSDAEETRPPEIRITEQATTPATVGHVGTPAYMAPEQAEARHDLIDARTDIYGLGAILFEILTGRPPFEGKGLSELLRRIVVGETPRARAIEPAVPRVLEAICARAMAKSRAERYSRALDLAEDVQRWIADEPTSAYRDPPLARVGRWARRHKPAVSGIAALLVTAVAALAVTTVLVNREKANKEHQRRLAESNFRLANRAADEMLREVGDVDLADVPQMEPVRRRLLEKARLSYQEFLKQRGDEQVVRWGAGRAHGRLGDVLEMMGEYPSAERDYRRAIELLGPLSEKTPDFADFRRDLAHANHGLGVLLKRSDRFRESEAALAEAIRLRRQLVAESPDDGAARQALANSQYQLGTLLARLSGRRPENERVYRDALGDQEALVARNRGRAELRATLGRYLNNLGMLIAPVRPDEAEALFREAVEIEEALVAQSPMLPGPRWQLARSGNNLGVLLMKSGGHEREAEERLQRSAELLATLSAEFPKIPQYRRELASVLTNLGLLMQQARGRRGEAEQHSRRALGLLNELADESPRIPEYRQKAASASIQLHVLVAETNPRDAERVVRDALARQETLVTELPDVPEYKNALGRNYYELGRLLVGRGDPAGACACLERAIRNHRAVLSADRGNRTYQECLGDDYGVWTIALIAQGDHARAADSAEELPRIQPEVLKRSGDAATFVIQCASIVVRDDRLTESKRRELESSYLRRAVKILEGAAARGLITKPDQLDFSEFLPLRNRDDFKALRGRLEETGAVRAG